VEVGAFVQPRDQLDEPDRIDVVDRSVPDSRRLGRVARHREHVAQPFGMRAEEKRLEPAIVESRAVRWGSLRSRFALDRSRRDHAAHPGARARLSFTSTTCAFRNSAIVRALRSAASCRRRRVELHRDDELARGEQPCKLGRRFVGHGALTAAVARGGAARAGRSSSTA